MEFDGWNYCYENLPYWEVRNRFPYVYDQFTQSPLGKHAILIYSIAEISMCNEVGCLAVFESKEYPFLVSVSYTHLDVYKRQLCLCKSRNQSAETRAL